jgi:hypothetical protein
MHDTVARLLNFRRCPSDAEPMRGLRYALLCVLTPFVLHAQGLRSNLTRATIQVVKQAGVALPRLQQLGTGERIRRLGPATFEVEIPFPFAIAARDRVAILLGSSDDPSDSSRRAFVRDEVGRLEPVGNPASGWLTLPDAVTRTRTLTLRFPFVQTLPDSTLEVRYRIYHDENTLNPSFFASQVHFRKSDRR